MKTMKKLMIIGSLLLACVFCFTACEGTIQTVTQTVSTLDSNQNVSEDLIPDLPLAGAVHDIPADYEELLDETRNDEPIGDGCEAKRDVVTETDPETDAYSFAIYETAYRLSLMGYDVFRGAAVIGDKLAYGLLFTTYESLEENYTCGFLELLEPGMTATLTDELVAEGIVAVPDSESHNEGFLIDRYVSLNASSGVYEDYYFKTTQTSNYAVEIELEKTAVAHFDENIDCYDYNKGITKWLADVKPSISFEACSFYTADEAAAYNTAIDVIDQIIALQNSKGYAAESYTLVVIEVALLEALALGEQVGVFGTEGGGYYGLNQINALQVEENQIVVVTADDGVQIVTVPTEAELRAAAEQRKAGGIIQVLGGILMAVGSVALCVVTCGTAAPVVAAVSVVLGAVAVTYAVSNIVEGVQDIIYGANGDVTSVASNPVRDLLATAIGDEKTANIVFHAVGLGSALLQSLLLPVNTGLGYAHAVNAGVGKTILIVARVVAVEMVKMAVTAVAASFASLIVEDVVTDLTGSVVWGKVSGFATGLLTGFATYRGLTVLDKKFNFSGIYSNNGLRAQYSNRALRKKLLSNFSEEEWNSMSLSERKENIQELANYIAKELGLEQTPEVTFYYSDSDYTYGAFNKGTYTVKINTYYFDSADSWSKVVETLSHELRHAWQYWYAQIEPTNPISDSFNHYKSSSVYGFDEYWEQLCEVDARDYGAKWTELLKGVVGK